MVLPFSAGRGRGRVVSYSNLHTLSAPPLTPPISKTATRPCPAWTLFPSSSATLPRFGYPPVSLSPGYEGDKGNIKPRASRVVQTRGSDRITFDPAPAEPRRCKQFLRRGSNGSTAGLIPEAPFLLFMFHWRPPPRFLLCTSVRTPRKQNRYMPLHISGLMVMNSADFTASFPGGGRGPFASQLSLAA